MAEKRLNEITDNVVKSVLNEYDIQEITPEEMEEYYKAMEPELTADTEPKVGIFWYLPFEKKLIGVVSVSVQSLMATKKFTSYISCDELHQDVWKKKFNYQKYHGGKDPYVGDYKNIPRGRIFYNSKTNEFDIMVGSWIKEGDNIFCIDLVKNEFNLNDQKCNVKVGIHWEIGMGWENR